LEITRRTTLPELAKLGFRQGENLVIDERTGDPASLPKLAREVVAGHPDAIIAVGGEAIRAVRQATQTIPVVMFGSDPVGLGYAQSLAHPGGNMTGVVILAVELDGKRVDLLHEAVPELRRLAGLLAASSPGRQTAEREMRTAATKDGVEFTPVEVNGPQDYAAAFDRIRAAGAQGVAITANPFLYRDGAELARLANQNGVASVCEWGEMARSGCLLGYGPNRDELRRRMAHQLAQILQGAKPGDLPIEQPTHFELIVNLETAKVLGLTVPQSLLARADEVIE